MNTSLYQVLIETARKGPEHVVHYSDLAVMLGLTMENPQHRIELGRLLGEISEYEIAQGRPMLSSIVVHKESHLPGRGFYECGKKLGQVRSGEDSDAFAIRQMRATWSTWERFGPEVPVDCLSLPSGCAVQAPLERLIAFCREEYAYYDGIASLDADHIEPLDVLATVAMNSFVNSATRVRNVHQGMARNCDQLLAGIPVDADLLTFDPSLKLLNELLHAAVQVRGVLLPVATKVLHRKRRGLIPMLDNVVIGYYLEASERHHLISRAQDGAQAATVAIEVLRDFREDLRARRDQIGVLQRHLQSAGFQLSLVRVLELLIWTQAESRGYYRTA